MDAPKEAKRDVFQPEIPLKQHIFTDRAESGLMTAQEQDLLSLVNYQNVKEDQAAIHLWFMPSPLFQCIIVIKCVETYWKGEFGRLGNPRATSSLSLAFYTRIVTSG